MLGRFGLMFSCGLAAALMVSCTFSAVALAQSAPSAHPTSDAAGSVYNLHRLAGFNGVYVQARTRWAVDEQGEGQMWLQNSSGAYLRLRARRQRLSLHLGADGMVVRLGS
jgi:hypothetical protein